jgi:transposase
MYYDRKYLMFQNIGGAKLIKDGNIKDRNIEDGNIVVDRDYNGARGIFLRALRDPALTSGCMA